MSEDNDIEKRLREFRESRDKDLPADRRLLPVHKDRLLAEARRLYRLKKHGDWLTFFRPMARIVAYAAPVLILAFAGYLWLKSPDRISSGQAVDRKLALKERKGGEESGDHRTESAETFLSKEEAKKKSTAPSEAAVDSLIEIAKAPSPLGAIKGVAGFMSGGGPVQIAQMDLSGEYRSHSQNLERGSGVRKEGESPTVSSSISDEKKLEERNEKQFLDSGKQKRAQDARQEPGLRLAYSNFANFKLIQTSNTIVLVDAAGSKYVGQIAADKDALINRQKPEKSTRPSADRQPMQNVLSQVTLVGTNQITKERLDLVASFYLEPTSTREASTDGKAAALLAGGKAHHWDYKSARTNQSVNLPPASPACAPKPLEMKPPPAAETNQIQVKQDMEMERVGVEQNKGQGSRVGGQESGVKGRGAGGQVVSTRLGVILERIDIKNNRQEPLVDAERIDK